MWGAPVPLGRPLPPFCAPGPAPCCAPLHGIVLPVCACEAGGCLGAAGAVSASAAGAFEAGDVRGGRDGPAPPVLPPA